MKASEHIAHLQALIAAHGDMPVIKEYFYGGYDNLVGPPKLAVVHACPWMVDAYWGEYEDHYGGSEHPSIRAIVID